jgi:hypothetical protein
LEVTDLYLLGRSALGRVVREATVRSALEQLDDIGVLATTAVVDLEIGYSARTPAWTRTTAGAILQRQ